MRDDSACRAILLFTPPLLLQFPIAVLILALERISRSLLPSESSRNFRSGDYQITLPSPTFNNATDVDIPLRLNPSPSYLVFGLCCLSYLVSAIGVFGIWELRKVEGTPGHQRVWSWLILTSNTILVGASLGILGYTSSVVNNETGWSSTGDIGRRPRWTKETWACQIDEYFPSSGWAGSACGTAKATRYLLIALAVASVLVLVSLWAVVKRRGGFKWLMGGKGRYAGFEDAYHMQPPGGHAAYRGQAAPQWGTQTYQHMPGPYQQWPQQGQAYEQPLHQPQQMVANSQPQDAKPEQTVFFR
jgi:hypothetical protein